MTAYALEITDEPTEADCLALQAGLRAGNEPHLGPADSRPLGIFARRSGELMGGLTGATARGMLHVAMLWVSPAARGTGLGSRLLARAEGEARARSCAGVWLDTWDFQARPFYERHGYRLFGTLEGYARGHVRFFMTKRL